MVRLDDRVRKVERGLSEEMEVLWNERWWWLYRFVLDKMLLLLLLWLGINEEDSL